MFYRTSGKIIASVSAAALAALAASVVFHLIMGAAADMDYAAGRFIVEWMTAIGTATVVYMANRRHRVYDVEESRRKITFQVVLGFAAAVVGGVIITVTELYMTGASAGAWETVLYETAAVYGIMMLVLGVMRWTGIWGMFLAALLALLMAPAFIKELAHIMAASAVIGICLSYLSLLMKDQMKWQKQFLPEQMCEQTPEAW